MNKIYGIDLGTTNSLLGYNGTLLTGLVPSVVNLQSSLAGSAVVDDPDAIRSFKVDISLFKEGEASVAASARVLSQLVKESKQAVKRVVISVPAYFSDNQRQATRKAAELVGLEVVSLINEPTAAAIAISEKRQSLSVVFDLGGGTFDVSIVDSRLGDYDVQATDGCILGGDNFDHAIMRWVIREAGIKVHHFFPNELAKLKFACCSAKVQIQKTGQPVNIDCSSFDAGVVVLTVEKYVELMKHTFAKAIQKARGVIMDYIPEGEDYDLLFVGGSTRCPYLREWVCAELSHTATPMFYDPDCIVAIGASMYGKMVEDGSAELNVSDVTKALSVGLADGTCHVIIPRNSKIPVSDTTIAYNHIESSKLRATLWQGDNLLTSDNEFIGTLLYDYGRVVAPGEGEVIVGVSVDADGTIHFSCKELLREPVEVVLERVNR